MFSDCGKLVKWKKRPYQKSCKILFTWRKEKQRYLEKDFNKTFRNLVAWSSSHLLCDCKGKHLFPLSSYDYIWKWYLGVGHSEIFLKTLNQSCSLRVKILTFPQGVEVTHLLKLITCVSEPSKDAECKYCKVWSGWYCREAGLKCDTVL